MVEQHEKIQDLINQQDAYKKLTSLQRELEGLESINEEDVSYMLSDGISQLEALLKQFKEASISRGAASCGDLKTECIDTRKPKSRLRKKVMSLPS